MQSDQQPQTPRLDPEIARFVALQREGMAARPDFADSTMAQKRAIVSAVRKRWREGGPGLIAEDCVLPDEAGTVRARIYRGNTLSAKQPALIYIHGGGFAYFSLDTHDRLLREYAAAARCTVIGLDYSLSPEARYPVALNEVVAAVRWLCAHGSAMGIDGQTLVLGGDSAGANLSVATALTLRNQGDATFSAIKGLLFNYGFFDASEDYLSQRLFGSEDQILTTRELTGYMTDYVRGPDDLADPLVQPIHARLDRLPPSLHVIAQCDPLADSCVAMAEAMRAAGCEVDSHVYEGVTHSFLEAVSISRKAQGAIADTSVWISKRLT